MAVFRQVEGDTVTLSFEMRSGREHNTPDKAMWGFQVHNLVITRHKRSFSPCSFL